MLIKNLLLKKTFILVMLIALLVPLLSSALPNTVVQASAGGSPSAGGGGGGGAPPGLGHVSYLNTMANRCQDLPNPGNGSFSNGLCSYLQSQLASALGCSDHMFTDTAINGVDANGAKTVNYVWLIDEGLYKDCYNKAGAKLNDLNVNCQVVNSSQNSSLWNQCQGGATSDQGSLSTALGCSPNMFNSIGSGDYRINSANWTNCQNALNAVGAQQIKILGPSGTVVPDTNPISSAAVGSSAPPSGSSGSSGGLTCDTFEANPLNWVICPVVSILVKLISLIDSFITNALTINTNNIFCTTSTTCGAYHDAWSSFRDIALGLMSIVGLAILIAQALGVEVLDAYTIRKSLPRLLIAAIGITLSWPLMDFLITLSNDLGFGVRHLIYAPFSHLSHTIDLNFGGNPIGSFFGELGVAAGVVAVGIPAAILAGGIGALIAYAGTALLAVFVAFIVLTIRQVVVIVLMLVAPIAIIAYVLPNTQNIYKLWWQSFSRALLMFPLIAAFIAAGRVFSAVALSSGGVINGFLGFAAYFAPYFLIPLTFRLSGGIMGGIGNFVNSRSQGGFKALAQVRANARKTRRENLGSGTALNEDVTTLGYDKFAKRFNRLSSGTANLKNAGYNPYKMKDRMAAARSTRDFELANKAMQEDQQLRYALANDDVAEALLPKVESYKGSGHFGSHSGDADGDAEQFFRDRGYTEESGLKEMVALHRQARRKLSGHSMEIAAWNANWRTGTGFSEKMVTDEHGVQHQTGGVGESFMQLAEITKGANGGDQLRANMIASQREGATSQRRSDVLMSFTESVGLARDVATTGGRSAADISSEVRRGAAKGRSRGEHITGRPQAIKAMVPQFIETFDHIVGSGSEKEFMQELAMAGAGQQIAAQASPENGREHAKYMNHEIDLKNLPANIDPQVRDAIYRTAQEKERLVGGPVDKVTVQDMLDVSRGNRELTAMTYQYGNEFAAANAQAARAAAEAGFGGGAGAGGGATGGGTGTGG